MALIAAASAAATTIVATVVHAMSVSPVVVDLQTSGQGMSQIVTVENKYATPIVLEMTATEAEYTDEGLRGTGKPTEDLLVFPPQAQLPAGGSQAVRIQYVGKPDIDKSKHYFVSVAQLPVKLPEGESAVQLLYNFQVVAGVSVPGGRPNIKVDSAEAYMGGDNKPRLLLVLTNDSNTYGYLSGGSLRVVQKDASGKEVFRRSLTPDQISQEIGFGLVGAGQKRRMSTPIALPQMGGQVEVSFTPSRR